MKKSTKKPTKSKRKTSATNLAPMNQTYGELKEDLHFTGYAYERGCYRLRKMLSDESWRQCAGGFSDIDTFLGSLQLDQFAKLTEEKREIAKLIKDLRPEVSTRAIGRALNTPESTMREKRAAKPEKINPNNEGARESRAKSISGSTAGKLVVRREEGKQVRLDKLAADEERVLKLMPVPGKFRGLVFDPAWDYDWLSIAGRAKPGYAMQTHEQLMAIDVRQWAADECHLYLWVTNNFMARGCELMKHWGFQHRTVLTWEKEGAFGLGSYFRNSTEHVLFGTLGETTTRHAAASIPTYFRAARGEHSAKPEEFYNIVRAASYPPFGEANQRDPREGFTNLYCPVTEKQDTEAAE